MKLWWLDLETTGLNPATEQILEVAVMEADFDRPFDAREVYQRVIGLQPGRQLDPFIINMRSKNGLLAEATDPFGKHTFTKKAEEELLALLSMVGAGELIAAGFSVHFDVSFLRHHMPTLASCFSHKLYDVSAVKLFCQSIGMPKFPKGDAHRAMADIRESIAHAAACVEWLRDRFYGVFPVGVPTSEIASQ